jgi:uncharacterized BrkB/YihY/UPF0761 family membrane protein
VVKKYGDDGGGREAALITYYGFLSIFPLLLIGVAVLSRVLTDHPDLRQRLINAIVPEALQATVEHAVTTLPTSAIPLAVGLIGLLFSGTALVMSALRRRLRRRRRFRSACAWARARSWARSRMISWPAWRSMRRWAISSAGHNRATWAREVENDNEWTRPAGPEVIARARAGTGRSS